MKEVLLSTILFMMIISSYVSASIGIGVSPSKLSLDFSKYSNKTISFSFCNQGDTDALDNVTSDFPMTCDWCSSLMPVQAHTWFNNGTSGSITFSTYPNGIYHVIISVTPNATGTVGIVFQVAVTVVINSTIPVTTTTTLPTTTTTTQPTTTTTQPTTTTLPIITTSTTFANNTNTTATSTTIPTTTTSLINQTPITIPTCKSQGAVICGINQMCSGKWLDANDTDKCCSKICVPAEPKAIQVVEYNTTSVINSMTIINNNMTINVITQNIAVVNILNNITIIQPAISQNITIVVPNITAFNPVNIKTSDVGDTLVMSVDLNTNESVSNVTIHIDSSQNIPENVQRPSNATVYSYVKVDTQNIDDSKITAANISFKLPKKWEQDNNVSDPSKVVLQRYSNELKKWNQLPTELISSDDSNYYYEAKSPGLSLFAIGISGEIFNPIMIEKGKEGNIVVNLSWVLVIMSAILILSIKYVYPRMVRSKNEIRQIERQLEETKRVRGDATKKYYMRQLTEEAYKQILKDLDEKKMQLEARLSDLKEPPKRK